MNFEGPSPSGFLIIEFDPESPELLIQYATLTRTEKWAFWHKLTGAIGAQLGREMLEVIVPLDARYALCRLTGHGLIWTIQKIAFAAMEESTDKPKKENWFYRTLHGLKHFQVVLAVVIGMVTLGGLIVHAPWSIQLVRKADPVNAPPAPAATVRAVPPVPVKPAIR